MKFDGSDLGHVWLILKFYHHQKIFALGNNLLRTFLITKGLSC